MKILSKKECDEILKMILANEIIQAECGLNDIESETKATENRAIIAFMVGGVRGVNKVLNTAWNYKPPKKEQKVKNERDVGYARQVDEEPRTLETVPLDWKDWIFNDKNYH